MSAWAPLVPLVKTRLGLSDTHLGLLLLCPGVGLLATMPIAGALTGRYGTRRVAPIAGAVAACTLPALASLHHIGLLGLVLVIYGAAGGMTDVAMNVHAIVVERTSGRAMMSGFHGLWSVGCVAGAGLVTLMLASGLTPLSASIVVSAVTLLLLAVSGPLMLPGGGEPGGPAFVVPHGMVLLLGVCCAVLFLAEGGGPGLERRPSDHDAGRRRVSRRRRLRRIRLGDDCLPSRGRPDRPGAWAVAGRNSG
jgi:MFS family permease